jgi:hypothetical protein
VQVSTGPASVPAIDPARLAAHIRILASDEFEGRAPASPGEERTVNYLVQQLSAAGVQPGGPNGSWFQEVPLNQYDIVGTPSLSFTVAGQRQPLTQGEEIAVRASMLNVDRVSISNAPLVFVGYGVRAPERNWDDFKGQDMRGKIGIVLVNDPDFETGEGDFGGKTMTYYGRWTYKFEIAAELGMAGMLVSARNRTGLVRLGDGEELEHQHDVRHRAGESRRGAPDGRRVDPARHGGRAAPRGGTRLRGAQAAGADARFPAGHLNNATFSATTRCSTPRSVRATCSGSVPGSTHPNETILYGAHWDHLGIGRARRAR